MPPEGSEDEPRSGPRYGKWNPYTLAPYFKVFTDNAQPISPVTGRTAENESPLPHLKVATARSQRTRNTIRRTSWIDPGRSEGFVRNENWAPGRV